MARDHSAIASARPGFRVGGEDQPRLDAGLLRLVCGETEVGLAHCEAEFGNWGDQNGRTGFLWFDRRLLEFGRDFVVRIGSATVFDGRLMALDARFPAQSPPTLAVRAEDRLQDLRMTRRTRSFERMSDAAVVSQVARDHGLTPQVDLAGAEQDVVVQLNQSDLAFVRARTLAADGELWLEGQTLHATRRASRNDAQLELALGARLRSFEVCADLAHQRTAVRCTGWDVTRKQAVAAEAAASAISSESSGGTSGPDVLRQALGERKDTVAHTVPSDDGAARGCAEAHLRATARRFLRGRGLADADARIRVGRRITLQGLGPLFSGAYGVVEVCHRFDPTHGLWTEFVVERPWIGNASS
ncbi:contractile injection system protein, VgrG/Pvc8 family [Aquabacterium sp. A7-Y]|uniref:phage late control D family protein n=1 Tax=Aquabacterium sp. A7-Y TaxID=1349605 RepID=UPI00223C9A0E|nr:contractile injection system protein, VgrG/Pvc8 family [Aquabacterium sp. A7-Y]MCW7541370.1 contractile injection system protein, VgrG/Pvc8 family [Aquabacterium sp. A7-Y]